MKPLAYHTLDTAKIVILAALLVVGVQYVFAWSGPPGNPPPDACPSGQPGCDPPVNVGGGLQTKLGDFGAASLQAFAIAAIDISGGTDVSIGGTANGIVINDGDLTASNGAVKGASIENLGGSAQIDSSGNIKGASFNVGSTEVISSSKIGTFTGGVKVGTHNDTVADYFQPDVWTDGGLGDPKTNLSDACNESIEAGKIIFNKDNGLPYMCIQGRSNTSENGWKVIAIDFVSSIPTN